MPALLAFGGNEGKRQQNCDTQKGHDEKKRRLHLWWQIGEDGVNPQEEEIGLGNGSDDGGIRLSAGAKRAEHEGAYRNRSENRAGEDEIFPEGARNEGNSIRVRKLVVLLHVRFAPDDAARHGPVIDAELQY